MVNVIIFFFILCHFISKGLLTHWGGVTHICIDKLIIIGSDNGLSPDPRQAIIWTNAGLLSIGPLLTYFGEHLIKIQQFSLKKMHMKMLSLKWHPSCLGLNVLTDWNMMLVVAMVKVFVEELVNFRMSNVDIQQTQWKKLTSYSPKYPYPGYDVATIYHQVLCMYWELFSLPCIWRSLVILI